MKDMINEILKTFNIGKTCDDMFDTVILCDDYAYTSYIENLQDDGEELPKDVDESTDIEQLVNNVAEGKIPKPKWFKEAEEYEGYDNYSPSTYLHLIPKEKEYAKIGKLVHKFLYSTDHEASNG